jgi:type VI secretion system secreted protein Hcp
MKSIEIRWYRTTEQGEEENYFTTTLSDATISNMKQIMVLTKDKTKMDLPFMEDVAFTYKKIVWRHETAKTEAQDDWTK